MTGRMLHKIGLVLVGAFIAPVLVYFLGLPWNKFLTRLFGVPATITQRKLARTFLFILPVFTVASYAKEDSENLLAWWHESPFVASTSGALLFVGIPAASVWLILHIWQRATRPRIL